ncbi:MULTISPECIES: hypothetical protein [Acinetobacter]|uniref:hypothetical protein n=1 Tax=Acinetobacter TaxID=469 RepID=UPI001250671D|nr:hypothetical protein [Acinetobacter oleivorans]
MKKIVLVGLILLFSCYVSAESYSQSKKLIRNSLVTCLKDPENSKFSAAYNSCLLDASNDFLEKANIEFKQQYNKGNTNTRDLLTKDRNIYTSAIKFCEIYQNLSYEGFTKEALCKLQTAKEYLSLLKNGNSALPNDWKIEDRVDKLFIGY